MIRPPAGEKSRQLFPGAEHRSGCLQRAAVGAPVAHGDHGVQHRLHYLRRLVQRGSSVIQIDHGSHLPVSLFSGKSIANTGWQVKAVFSLGGYNYSVYQ